jgi:hypothetical protein
MRKLLWLIAVLLFLGFVWLVGLRPTMLGHINDGIRDYIGSVPISGNADERKVTYTLVWGFTPLKMEIQDFKMQGPRAEWDKIMFFDPVLSAKYIKFDPRQMMFSGKPTVTEISQLDFEGKIPYRTLLKMLAATYPNFHPHDFLYIKGNTVDLSGVLQEVQSEITLTGQFQVNADGELEFIPTHVQNFLREEVMDTRSKDKVLRAFQPKWKFKVMDLDLKVDKAAVSEGGVWIKAESAGKKLGSPQNVPDTKQVEKEKGK